MGLLDRVLALGGAPSSVGGRLYRGSGLVRESGRARAFLRGLELAFAGERS